MADQWPLLDLEGGVAVANDDFEPLVIGDWAPSSYETDIDNDGIDFIVDQLQSLHPAFGSPPTAFSSPVNLFGIGDHVATPDSWEPSGYPSGIQVHQNGSSFDDATSTNYVDAAFAGSDGFAPLMLPADDGTQWGSPNGVEAAVRTPGLDTDTTSSESGGSATSHRSGKLPIAVSDAVPRARKRTPKQRVSCPVCSATEVADGRSLARHMWSAHNIPEQPGKVCRFSCRCNYETPRRDNMLRHLRGCKKEPKSNGYRCECGREELSLKNYSTHLRTCNRGSPGRPRKADNHLG